MEDLCFWAQTLRGVPVPARLEGALAGGFASMSTVPADCPDLRQAARVRRQFDDAGVRLRAHDPYIGWLPRAEPPGTLPAELQATLRTHQADFLATVEILRPEAITVVEPFGRALGIDEFAGHFAAICDLGAEIGVKVQLEFAPITGIPDLATAWEIVRRADRPNGGLVFDTYHYFRGTHDDSMLERVPGDRIFAIHLNDGPAQAPRSLVEETLHHRLLPGEGEWDLVPVLTMLLGKPGIGDFGVEASSDRLSATPPRLVGQRAGATLRSLLGAARGQLEEVA